MQDLQEISQTTPPPIVSAEENLAEIIGKLPPDSNLTLYKQSWEDYENLLETVGEASGLRISFTNGVLQIMTLSTEHENYAQIITRIVDRLSVYQDLEIAFFGSATIKKPRRAKGTEPDACFYVQSVEKIGNKIRLDFSIDPPPDIVVEIDLHHQSLDKFPIYAALGVSEIWRYDGEKFEIFMLEKDEYKQIEKSLSLPALNSQVLGELLNRSQNERQTRVLKDFENWLKERI